MKILHVTNLYPIPERPQFGIFVQVLVHSLKEQGVDGTVLLIPGFAGKLNYLRGNLMVKAALRKERYDVVHIHYGLTLLSTLFPLGLPSLVSFYGSDLLHPMQKRISNMLAFRADLHTVQSNQMARHLSGPKPIIMPTGVDCSTFFPIDKAAARRELGLPADSPIAIFVAHPENPVKQFPIAARAVEEARTVIPALHLIPVYGQPHRVVNLYMNAADLLLVTSRWEGSPNIVKEALACNLPVVSFDVGDVVERIEGVTPSFVEKSFSAFVERVIGLAQSPVRSNGREIVAALSHAEIARRHVDLYSRLMAGHAAGGM